MSQSPSDIYLLCHRVLYGLQAHTCSSVDFHGLQNDSLPHHSLHQGETRNAEESLLWCLAELFLSHVLIPLSSCRLLCHSNTHKPQPQLLPLVKCVIPQSLPPLLMGSALAASHRNHSCSSPIIKALPHKSNTICHYLRYIKRYVHNKKLEFRITGYSSREQVTF